MLHAGADVAPATMLCALMVRGRPGVNRFVPYWWSHREALVLHQRLDVSPVGLEAHLKLTLSLRGSKAGEAQRMVVKLGSSQGWRKRVPFL